VPDSFVCLAGGSSYNAVQQRCLLGCSAADLGAGGCSRGAHLPQHDSQERSSRSSAVPGAFGARAFWLDPVRHRWGAISPAVDSGMLLRTTHPLPRLQVTLWACISASIATQAACLTYYVANAQDQLTGRSRWYRLFLTRRTYRGVLPTTPGRTLATTATFASRSATVHLHRHARAGVLSPAQTCRRVRVADTTLLRNQLQTNVKQQLGIPTPLATALNNQPHTRCWCLLLWLPDPQEGVEFSLVEAKKRGMPAGSHFCDYLLFLDADQVSSPSHTHTCTHAHRRTLLLCPVLGRVCCRTAGVAHMTRRGRVAPVRADPAADA
jgi:hypothetical protein